MMNEVNETIKWAIRELSIEITRVTDEKEIEELTLKKQKFIELLNKEF